MEAALAVAAHNAALQRLARQLGQCLKPMVAAQGVELHELYDQQAIEEGVRQPVPCETTLHSLNAEWNTNVGHGLRVVFRQKLESRAKRGKTFRRPPEV